MKGESDGTLVQRVLAGDQAAYALLVERYRDRLGRYAVRMLGNVADAEDALQETFVRGYRSLGRCVEPERFGAWLFGILVNRCRTIGGQRARRQQRLVHDEAAVKRSAVGHTAENDMLREAIEWALAQLPSRNREAFVLKHIDDLSYEEMAEVTGVGVSALKMRVMRAREELRQLLSEADRD